MNQSLDELWLEALEPKLDSQTATVACMGIRSGESSSPS